MPVRYGHGVQRTEWRKCDRCGFMYPITMLTRQLGLLVCASTCRDDISILYRATQIAKVLAVPGEGMSEQAEKFKDPGEVLRF